MIISAIPNMTATCADLAWAAVDVMVGTTHGADIGAI
jgi:hypothetical protein